MSSSDKFPVSPECLARVRDEAWEKAKRSDAQQRMYLNLAMAADAVLQSYPSTAEVSKLQKVRYKVSVS